MFHCNGEKLYVVGNGPWPVEDFFFKAFCFHYNSKDNLFLSWTTSHKSLRELIWIIYTIYSAILQNMNYIRNTVPCKVSRQIRGGSWWWSSGTLSYNGDRSPPSGMFPGKRRRRSASNRRTPPDQAMPPSAVTFLCENNSMIVTSLVSTCQICYTTVNN